MSHVCDMKLEVNDLECLKGAAAAIGLKLVEKNQYKWFGRHVGDYPVPEGLKKEDLGRCDYAIQIPGNDKAYEVGVVKRKDGKPGYQLIWDFWQGGFGLQEKIGKDGGLLKQSYAAMRAKKELLRKGYRSTTQKDNQGNLILTFTE